MIFVYNAFLYAAVIVFFPVLLIAVALSGKLRKGFPHRLGVIPRENAEKLKNRKIIWFHAASVGEAQALIPVIREMKKIKKGYDIITTTTSINGMKKHAQELGGVILFTMLLPFDFGFIMRGFIKKVRPEIIVIVETELWPNLINEASKAKVPLILANGRISVKSFKWYYSARLLFGRLLNKFELLIMQSEKMVKRLRKLGVKGKKVLILNNTKYSEGENGPAKKFELKDAAGRKIIAAGSIRPGEEECIIKAASLLKSAPPLLVIAPRHMDRVHAIAKLLAAEGIGFKLWTDIKEYTATPEYSAIILNTVGELRHVYPSCDIAVIGGGFKKFGGHNPIEAAVASLPIVMGVNMYNFEDTCDKLVKEGGAFQVESRPHKIAEKLDELLENEGLRKECGAKNAEAIDKLRGSAETTALLIDEIMIEGAR